MGPVLVEYTVRFETYTPILKTLNEAGFEAYFVGGAVRDHVLGMEPKDVDIATSATPDQVAELFPGTEMVGAHFGVSLVKLENEAVEVATFRHDGVYVDNRRPSDVTFTTEVTDDLCRRDFTVNALVMNAEGRVFDYVGGKADAAARVLRCVGDPNDRFEQDALRLMRAVRFACKLDFTIHPDTFAAMKANAHRIRLISVERVRQELEGILTSGHADKGVQLLLDSGLLVHFLPEVAAMVGCEQNPVHHPEGDVFVHTLLLLKGLTKGCSVTLALAALLHDVGKPATFNLKNGQPTFHGHAEVGAFMTREVLTRMRCSNDVVDTVCSAVSQHMHFMVMQDMRKATLLRFVRQPNFDELLALHKLDASAGLVRLENAEFVENLMSELPQEKLTPTPLVNGNDLKAMGLRPGPSFKTFLQEVETAQLEGRVTTKEGALELVRELAVNVSAAATEQVFQNLEAD